MLRRALTLAAALCLLVGPAMAADPGARAPITVGGAVNDVALAWGTGALGVAHQDPGSRTTPVPPAPDADAWHLYSPSGQGLQAGDADIAACEDSSALFDDCQTHATHVALSQDGTRMVVGSTPDNSNAILTFIRDTSGDDALMTLSGTLVDLAMSDNGQTVAAITDMGAAAGTGNHGKVFLFNWAAGSSGAVTQLWSDDLLLAATDVTLSPDGNAVAVAEGPRHHRYARSTASSQFSDGGFSGNAMDVAIGNGGLHTSVVGGSTGWFSLYDDQTGANRRELHIRDAEVSLDAVAIRADATAIALGNAAGDLWVYRLDPTLPALTGLVGKVALGAAVREIEFARDGNSIVVAYGNDVAHYAIETTGLVKLWSTTLTASSGDIAIDEHGERLAAATGSTAIVYEAKHRLNVTVPTLPAATPGQGQSVVLAYTNTGNRFESANIAVQAPSGWTAIPDKTTFRLAPDQLATVRINVTVPANEVPGSKEVKVTHTAGSAGTATTTLAFTVPSIEAWALSPFGSASLGIQAGGSNTFAINITNRGNVAKEPPVSISSAPAGWTATLAGHTGILAGGATRQATVTMTAPAGAAQLASGAATVVIPGAQGSPLVLTGTVGASFNVDVGGPDAATVRAGNTTRILLTVRNTGNAPDSVSLQMGNLPSGWTASFGSGTGHAVVNLPAGQTAQVPLDLTLPADAHLSSAVELSVQAKSVGDPARGDTHTFLAGLEDDGTASSSETSTSRKAKGSPGPEPLLLVGALVACAVMGRRRS